MPQALIGVILICKGLQIYSIVHWVETWKQGLPTMYGITKLDQGFEFCWLKKCYNYLSCFIQIRSVTNSASIHYCPQPNISNVSRVENLNLTQSRAFGLLSSHYVLLSGGLP